MGKSETSRDGQREASKRELLKGCDAVQRSAAGRLQHTVQQLICSFFFFFDVQSYNLTYLELY